ncbi:MAG: helix-turn-helix domain-containing protein [Candidatus Margulisbacteria bacterium]|nr:helix-turn-helix domain-containing protein [Candidatus Margulisiibacteriota bacterium]
MSENTIRFAVEKGFFICENDVFGLPLGPIDKLCYLALVRYADSQKRAWPSYNKLASDIGVGKKRAIEAVKTLVECKLIEKKVRGNRSNIYLVYPARFFCAQKTSENNEESIHNNGVQKTPQDNLVVSQGHLQGVFRTPSGCPRNTLRVSEEHPISTNISTNISTLSSTEEEREKLKNKKSKEKQRDLDIVKEFIARKGYEVNKKVLVDMLSQYSIQEIKAAINCTDFQLARNPLAVIYALLQSGRFLIPRKRVNEIKPHLTEEAMQLDKDTMRQYIEQLKNSLEKYEENKSMGDD